VKTVCEASVSVIICPVCVMASAGDLVVRLAGKVAGW
jgi:hypothetical protein